MESVVIFASIRIIISNHRFTHMCIDYIAKRKHTMISPKKGGVEA